MVQVRSFHLKYYSLIALHYCLLLSQLKMSLGIDLLEPWALSLEVYVHVQRILYCSFERPLATIACHLVFTNGKRNHPHISHKKKTLTNSTSNHSSTFIHQHLSCVSLPTLILLTVLLEKEILPHESKPQKSLDTRWTWLLWIWMAVEASNLIRRIFPRSQKGQLGKCRLYHHEIDTK